MKSSFSAKIFLSICWPCFVSSGTCLDGDKSLPNKPEVWCTLACFGAIGSEFQVTLTLAQEVCFRLPPGPPGLAFQLLLA